MANQYQPFQDYLGLSTVCWNSDLLSNLEDIMTPVCGSDSSMCSNLNVEYDTFTSFDPLDLIRSDAHEHFLTNGVDADLDELDRYQTHIRQRTTTDHRSVTKATNDNSVLRDYLASREKRGKKKQQVCVFCKNNGEPVQVYSDHVVKDREGKVSCPILRRYTCPICGVSGDNAHTIRYCPKSDPADQRPYLQAPPRSRSSLGRSSRH